MSDAFDGDWDPPDMRHYSAKKQMRVRDSDYASTRSIGPVKSNWYVLLMGTGGFTGRCAGRLGATFATKTTESAIH